MQNEISQLIKTQILRNDLIEFEFDMDLIHRGYMSSFNIIELMTLLEEKYQISITNEDIENKSLNSVDGIVALIKTRKG